MTIRTSAAITAKHLLYTAGASKEYAAVTSTAADLPLGTIETEAPAAEQYRALVLLGLSRQPHQMVASEAIGFGVEVFSTGGGKVGPRPTAPGEYWFVGTSIEPANADGDVVQVASCPAIKTVIA